MTPVRYAVVFFRARSSADASARMAALRRGPEPDSWGSTRRRHDVLAIGTIFRPVGEVRGDGGVIVSSATVLRLSGWHLNVTVPEGDVDLYRDHPCALGARAWDGSTLWGNPPETPDVIPFGFGRP